MLQLDMFGSRGRKKPSKAGGGQPYPTQPRPTSENYSAEPVVEVYVNSLGEEEVNREFERMLVNLVLPGFFIIRDDMNLTDEKREPLMNRTLMEKREMLSMHLKGTAAFILSWGLHLFAQHIYQASESRRIRKHQNLTKRRYPRDNRYERIEHEVIRCVRALMNNTPGLRHVYEHETALTIVSASMDVTKPNIMVDVVKLLAAVSIVPPNGHERVLKAITECAGMEDQERFMPIVAGPWPAGTTILSGYVQRIFLRSPTEGESACQHSSELQAETAQANPQFWIAAQEFKACSL
ncbi:hypothetical protein HPB48_005396 [Haemaphysalis longicornis]|uniref:Formin GTPase-binding domain-containing protein n=1 Tax=Haemaphysalis longicornis TaxID=44386 RepID=A0A9J6GGZ4_HAELO|nr:hypothetical protein HPB48_005396 [Haemaphysalis longicornis]